LAPLLSTCDIFIIQGETSIPNGVTDKDVSPFTNKVRPVAKEIVK
jgi:hypothetical protein